MYEESGFCLQTYVWFFRPNHRQLQRLYLAVLTGKAAFPTPESGHSQCTAGSEGSCRQGFRAPYLVWSSHIFIPSPGIFFPTSSCGALGRGTSAVTSLGSKRQKTWRQFYPVWPSTCSLLVLYLCAPPNPGSVKLPGPFVKGFLRPWATQPSLLC